MSLAIHPCAASRSANGGLRPYRTYKLPIRPQNVARSTSQIADIGSPTARSAKAISHGASVMPQQVIDWRGNEFCQWISWEDFVPTLGERNQRLTVPMSGNWQLIP